jgi:hypothetical protein
MMHQCRSSLVLTIDKYITMKNLENIAEDLFNKIRGRFPSVTIGDEGGKVTNLPTDARFFDFEYKEGDRVLGKVSISLDENSIAVMYSDNFVDTEDEITQSHWYNFLKELRSFSKKRLLNFDTRNITKSNLNRRDYKFLANTRAGEGTMSESKMYGTNRVSYQKVDGARLVVKHTESINTDQAAARTRNISSIYIESSEGERFKYPFKHLSGARAMARHVAEGGKPFDDFGTHITGLSEEMNKLRKFKSYMGRSAVMAESLAGYTDVVNERIKTVKKTIESLQKPNYYAEAIGSFEAAVMEDVPDDVKENWIDQLTIKQFNEELSDVFPYIYKLVSEATKAQELGPDDLNEADQTYYVKNQNGKPAVEVNAGKFAPVVASKKWDQITPEITQRANTQGFRTVTIQYNNMPVQALLGWSQRAGSEIAYVSQEDFNNMSGPEVDLTPNAERGESYESAFEAALESTMGQFGESTVEMCPEACCGKPVTECSCGPDCKHCDCHAKNAAMKESVQEERKTPLGEFILSYFDYTTGQFPKGETAILTMVEKDYGEQFINPAKQFFEKINNRVAEVMGYKEPVLQDDAAQNNAELDSIRSLAGL